MNSWDPSKHPRHPAGSSAGGEFSPALQRALGRLMPAQLPPKLKAEYERANELRYGNKSAPTGFTHTTKAQDDIIRQAQRNTAATGSVSKADFARVSAAISKDVDAALRNLNVAPKRSRKQP